MYLSLAGVLMLTGCDASQLDQLASDLEQAASTPAASPSGTPSPSSSPSSSPNLSNEKNAMPCNYTVSYTYDLGPGIDVNEGFEVIGSIGYMKRGISVLESVLQVNTIGCPVNTILPAAGDTQSDAVYEISSSGGTVNLYPMPYSQPTVLQESTPVDALVSSGDISLSMAVPQVSNGRETQIFDSGVLQSATQGSDALMVLQVTYDYTTENSVTPPSTF